MERPTDYERTANCEKAIYRYVEALDRADLDTLVAVLDLAIDDPELSQAIREINLAFEQETQLAPLAADAEIILTLIHRHLHSRELSHNDDLTLTVGEVAAKLKSERRVPLTDERTNNLLLNSQQPLPALLSLDATKRMARDLAVEASDRFWRAFRDAAITLSMGRGQESQLLAARHQREGRRSIGMQHKARHSRRKTDEEE